MRILHTIPSVNPSNGGPIEGVKQLGMLAETKGHRVEVASFDAPNAPFLASFPLTLHALGPGSGNYGYVPRFRSWLEANVPNYDLVIVNGIWQYHSFACWRVLRRTSTPYVVFTHGMLDPWFKRRYPLKHIKKWIYWPWAEYRVLRDAASVIFTCEEEKILARQSFWLYKAKELVVNYGTALPSGDPQIQREEFFGRFPQARGRRLLLFMGRIHPKKGCDLVIRAFASVLAKDQDWQLVFAGPDQVGWQGRLVELAEKLQVAHRITWAGMISGDLKWGSIHAAEALFLPSHQENFGIVVAEALSCGVPVLISNQVNIWREIQADGAGLVENDDLPGATQLLERWIRTSIGEKLLMRVAAHSSFINRFEVDQASKSQLSAFSRILRQRRQDLPGALSRHGET